MSCVNKPKLVKTIPKPLVYFNDFSHTDINSVSIDIKEDYSGVVSATGSYEDGNLHLVFNNIQGGGEISLTLLQMLNIDSIPNKLDKLLYVTESDGKTNYKGKEIATKDDTNNLSELKLVDSNNIYAKLSLNSNKDTFIINSYEDNLSLKSDNGIHLTSKNETVIDADKISIKGLDMRTTCSSITFIDNNHINSIVVNSDSTTINKNNFGVFKSAPDYTRIAWGEGNDKVLVELGKIEAHAENEIDLDISEVHYIKVVEDSIKLRTSENNSITVLEEDNGINLVSKEIRWVLKTDKGDVEHLLSNELVKVDTISSYNIGDKTIKLKLENGVISLDVKDSQTPISKTVVSIIDTPLEIETDYTGSEIELLEAGTCSTGGTLEYSMDNGKTFFEEIPKATNSGTYDIVYRIRIDDTSSYELNEELLTSDVITSIINKVDPEITIDPEVIESTTFTGPSMDLIKTPCTAVGGTPFYNLQNLESGKTPNASSITATDTGTYEVYYKIYGDTNHNDTDWKLIDEVTLISKDKTGVSLINAPAPKILNYTGSKQELVNAGTCSAGGEIKYSIDTINYSDDIPTATDAGEYKIWYKITINNSDSYELVGTTSGVVDVTVGKIDPIITAPTLIDDTIVEEFPINLISTKGSAIGGTMYYNLSDSDLNSTTNADEIIALEIGTYKLYYKVIGDSNHNNVAWTEVDRSVVISDLKEQTTLGYYSLKASDKSEIINLINSDYTSFGILDLDNNSQIEVTCGVNGIPVLLLPERMTSPTVEYYSLMDNGYSDSSELRSGTTTTGISKTIGNITYNLWYIANITDANDTTKVRFTIK